MIEPNYNVLEATRVSNIRNQVAEHVVTWSITFGALFFISAYMTLEYKQIGGSISNIWLTPAPDSAFEFREPVIGVHSFSDLLLHRKYASAPSPYLALEADSLPANNYPPFAHVFMLPFTLIPYTYAFAIFAILSIGMIVAPIGLALRGLSRPILISVLISGFVFTYPMLMIIDRGNIQGITTGFCLIGLWFFMGNKYKAAAALIGIAAALKIYPILLMLLFLKRRRYGEFFIGCAVAAVLTLGALATFEGGIKANVIGFVGAMGTFTSVTADGYFLLPRNHSPAAILTYLGGEDLGHISGLARNLLEQYSMFIALLFTITLLVVSIFFKIRENQLLLMLCVSIASIPMVTYGYALTMFFLVLVHILHQDFKATIYPKLYSFGVTFLISALFMAKGIPFGSTPEVTIRTIIDPLLLFLLFVLSLWSLPRKRIHSATG